ncbi:MAG: hypothetical protein ACTS6A_01230 [Candidatus Hodgkinia cicadicola]
MPSTEVYVPSAVVDWQIKQTTFDRLNATKLKLPRFVEFATGRNSMKPIARLSEVS